MKELGYAKLELFIPELRMMMAHSIDRIFDEREKELREILDQAVNASLTTDLIKEAVRRELNTVINESVGEAIRWNPKIKKLIKEKIDKVITQD